MAFGFFPDSPASDIIVARLQSRAGTCLSSNSVASRGDRTAYERASWTMPSEPAQRRRSVHFTISARFRFPAGPMRCSSVICCPMPWSNRPAPTIDSASKPRPFCPRPARPALDQDPANLRSAKPQARLLPVDGVPDRAVADQQRHEPDARAIERSLLGRSKLDWLGLVEQEPDAGLGNGGLGRLAACFLDSMATLQLPAMGYGLRYEYGMFRQSIENGWQREQPDNWLRRPDPWEISRPQRGRARSARLHLRDGGATCGSSPGRPSTLIGIPYDRPVVGFGGKTINTLRLWARRRAGLFRLPGLQLAATSSAPCPRARRRDR